MVRKKVNTFGAKLASYFSIILAATAGWAFYGFINDEIANFLLSIGISDSRLQFLIIILIAIIGLWLLGFGVGKAIDKVVGAE